MGPLGWTWAGAVSATGFVAVGLAFLGAPQLLVRWISARDRRQIEDGSLIAVLCIIVFDLGAVFTGIAGRALFPGLADQETILPTMAAGLLPAVFLGLYLVIVLAASMSTVDSLLILVSSVVARDVIQNVFDPELSERRIAFIGKLVTIVIGVGAIVFALEQVRLIFWFVLFAWSGLACAFTPVVLCSLFWPRTTWAGAIAGMVSGFLTAIVWVVAFKPLTLDLYEMIPGFAVAFIVTIIVSLVTKPVPGAAAELEDVHRTIGRRSGRKGPPPRLPDQQSMTSS
jgi:Na+/proline symporter